MAGGWGVKHFAPVANKHHITTIILQSCQTINQTNANHPRVVFTIYFHPTKHRHLLLDRTKIKRARAAMTTTTVAAAVGTVLHVLISMI